MTDGRGARLFGGAQSFSMVRPFGWGPTRLMRPALRSIACAHAATGFRGGSWWPILTLCLLPQASVDAIAADVYQADGIDIRWDNTVRLSEMFRLFPHGSANTANANADDGDRNFAAGLVSNRVDLLSEFDASDGDFGVHASGAAWYDTVYHQRNNNDSAATFNPISVPHNEFTSETQNLHGQHAELLDAFLYGSFQLGDIPATFRIGRHTLLWGESLFFADNGIAAAQAPLDVIKALNQPEAEAKELFRPVGQVSATLQPLPNLALSAYYQFEWEKTRLPGSGSYLSDADFLDAGGERLIVAPNEYLYRGPNVTPSSSGQFGIAVHTTQNDIDFGLYALQFNAKEPEIFLIPGIAEGAGGLPIITNPDIVNLKQGRIGDYELVYPEHIEVYGVSFSFYAGDNAIAGEISARRNMPLVGGFGGIPAYGNGGYGGGYAQIHVPDRSNYYPYLYISPVVNYPAGDTLHAQFSTVTNFSRSSVWDGADLSAEIAMNDLLDVTRDPYDLDHGRSRFAAAVRAVFTPQYFQVLPNLDFGVPVGLGLGVLGHSSIDGAQNAGAGDIDAGVSLTYRAVWKAGLTFTHFIGSASSQPFSDRDFVSISVQRTF